MILNKNVLIFSVLVLLLTACGGGGGSSHATTNTTGTNTSTDTTTDTTDTSDATSGTDTQCIQGTIDNNGMVAKAGDDITAFEGYSVTFNGLQSVHPSGGVIVDYIWCENGNYLGSGAGIHKNDFTMGTHTVTLIVNSNTGTSSSDEVIVNVVEDTNMYLSKIVKTTGQTTSYVDFDDGYYQKGMVSSYSRDNTNEIVTDNVTGFMWQDDTTGWKPYVTEESWNLQEYNNTSGDTAVTYCENLTLGGHTDWRLPSLRELQTIIDHETALFIPKTDSAFNINSSSEFWTSTRSMRFPALVWYVDFGSGEIDRWSAKDNRSVRCVRSDSHTSTYASFSRSNGIVVDNHTNLQWQDDYSDNNNNIEYANWLQGINYCENLTLGGYTDWRLPNKNELVSLHDHRKYLNAFDNIFQYHAGTNYFLTSTTNEDNYNEIYNVEFSEGDVSVCPKEDESFGQPVLYPIRCVRGN